MRRSRHTARTAAVVALLITAVPASAPAAEDFSPAQKTAIEKIIRDYLVENPTVLRDALMALERKQQEEERAQASQSIRDNADELFRSERDHVAGNPEGGVTMVEFFDYNCQFCKRSLVDVLKLIDTQKDLRMVLKEFPILGPGSLHASRAAIASKKQGKYWQFHLAMMKHRGSIDEETVYRIAGEVGLDVERLKADMEGPDVAAVIGANHELANRLGIQGTPAFVVADQLIPGALGYEALRKEIDAARTSDSCVTC